MRNKSKITYEKPTAVSLGPSGSIVGQPAVCSPVGTGATDTCSSGSDVAVIPYCPDGNVATAACETDGASAGQTCYQTGNTASWSCVSDGSIPG